MTPTPRVLLFSASIGSGHTRAAQAVERALQQACPGITARVVNLFYAVSPPIGKLVTNSYLQMVKHFPGIYATLYRWGNTVGQAGRMRDYLSRWLAKRLHGLVQDFAPDIIVCTHASPAGAMDCLKATGAITAPVVAVITDYVVHNLWLYPHIDMYMVADRQLARTIREQGYTDVRVEITGIPVDPSFAGSLDREALREKLGFAVDVPLVLLMGGGAGVLPMGEMVEALCSINTPLQLAVVCGHNWRLKQQLERMKGKLTQPVHIYGFIDHVHELMRACDLIITKPGGMTTAEALAQGVPMVVFRPIPGQEEGNTAFLLERQVARRTETVAQMAGTVAAILADREQLERMRINAKNLGKPTAAAEVAGIILAMLQKREQ